MRRKISSEILYIGVTCAFIGLKGHESLAATFGLDKSAEDCAAGHFHHDEKYLSGEWPPFFTTGPPQECYTDGCLDGFWAPQSRYQVEPTCPKALVHGLSAWMRSLHEEGSWWAVKVLTLQPCDLWEVMRDRTIWILGDSVTEGLGHAMAQMMLEYWDKRHWNETVSDDPAMMLALNYGATEGGRTLGRRAPYWCFMMGSPENRGRICYVKADRAKRLMHVLNLMTKLAQPDDIILANIGIHYNDMSELSEDMPLIGSALKQPGLSKNVFWIETSPQHFGSPTGMYNVSKPLQEQTCFPAGSAFNTELITLANGSLSVRPGAKYSGMDPRKFPELHRLIAGGERNLISQPIIDSLGVPTLRTWNLTLPLHQFHSHVHGGDNLDFSNDCTHMCHPSGLQLILVHFVELVRTFAAPVHSRPHFIS